jgi:hypothetical protein
MPSPEVFISYKELASMIQWPLQCRGILPSEATHFELRPAVGGVVVIPMREHEERGDG